LATAERAPASSRSPWSWQPQPPPGPAKTTTSSIAIVTLRLGRRREARHWLIASHGDPAGLAARLRKALAELASAANRSFSPGPNAAPPTLAGAPTRAEVGAEVPASPDPGTSARPQARSIAPAKTTAKAPTQARVHPWGNTGPEQLLQRAFHDCTTLERPARFSQANYHYQLSLPSGRLVSASMSCWRRYAPGGAWQRRCGPMRLTAFVEHYGAQPRQGQSVHLY